MSRFIDYRNPLSPVEQEIARLGHEERVVNHTTPKYILGDGTPSFSPPSSNILTNLTQKSARNSIDLGTGAGVLLNSGAGVASRMFYSLGDDTIPLSQREGRSVLSDGTVKNTDELSGTDYFNALSPTMRIILEQNGFTESNFKSVGTLEEASERYNNIRRSIFLDQSIRQYNQEHPHWATTTGIINFALDAVTDPINLVSFGAGGLAKSAGKTAMTETLERSLKGVARSVSEGVPFDKAIVLAGRDGEYLTAQLIDSVDPASFVAREVVNTDGQVYTVTSRVVGRNGDTASFEVVDISRGGVSVPQHGSTPPGPIITPPPTQPLLPRGPLVTPRVVLRPRVNKRTGLTDQLQDAYDQRLRVQKELDDFMSEGSVEVDLDLGLERIGRDIEDLKDIETRYNEVSKTVERLEKRVNKELAAAYKKRAALDLELEDFLKEGDSVKGVDLETAELRIQQDTKYLSSFDKRYAGVEKTIARLEGPDPSTIKRVIPETKPRTKVAAGKELGPANEVGLALRSYKTRALARTGEDDVGKAIIKYDQSILGAGVTDDVAQAVLQPGVLSPGYTPPTGAIAGGVAAGVAFDGMSQYAEHVHRTENLGIEEEFRYDFMRGGASAILVGGLAAAGAIRFGRQPKSLTHSDIIASNPASLLGIRSSNMVRNGSAAADARVSLATADALRRAERWSEAAYSKDEYLQIMDVLSRMDIVDGPANGPTEFSSLDVGAIFNHAPTFAEAMAFLRGGAEDIGETSVSKVLRELREATENLQKAKLSGDEALQKKLRKSIKKLEENRQILTDSFEFREGTEGYRYRAILEDVPHTDIYNPKADRLHRLRGLMALKIEDLPISTQGNISKVTSRVFDYLARLGSQGVAARHYQKMAKLGDSPIAQNVARMIGAIDSRIANDFYTTPDGKSVLTVEQNIALFSLKRSQFTNTYHRVMSKVPKADRAAIGREVMQARTGIIDADNISDSAKELLPLFSRYYDEMAETGVRNGALRSKLDNYVNIQFEDGVSNRVWDELSAKLAKFWRDEEFSDSSTKLHYGTLIRAKILKDTGDVVNTHYKTRPSKKSDLLPIDLERYELELDNTLGIEAKDAIARRQGRTKGRPEDPVVRDEGREVQYRTDNRASRTIEQKFWMSDDVLDMGIVDTELFNVMKSYERGMGAYIARQETMTDLFGEAVRFDDTVEVLRAEAKKLDNTDETKESILEAIDSLENMGKRVLGHNEKKATGLDKILVPILDLASGAIRQGVVIPMSTEVAVVGLSSLIRPSEAKLFVKHLREAFSLTKVREDLMAMGYTLDYERATDRFFGTSPFEPANAVGKSARWFKENSTIWFGEEALTNRLRRFSFSAFHMRTGRKLMSIVDRLENLDVKLDPKDPKSLSKAARSAGFGGDAAFARDVRRLGLATKSSRKALARFKEIDPDSLNHPTNATRIAMKETDPELQKSMLEVADALGILARERTDRFIVKRSTGTQFRDHDNLGTAMLQFLTYPTSWFNAYLKRGMQGPNHQLAGYMGAYLLGEVTASILRDVVYKGKSIDEIMDEWDEDFYTKIGRIAQRIPVAGPWTDFAVSPLISLITGDSPRFSLASTPAGSFMEQGMDGAIGILRKFAGGEKVDPQEIQNATRMVPILGSPPSQYIMGRSIDEE